MGRVGPTFDNTPTVGYTSVSNGWGVDGDTPSGFRIYTNPFNISQALDVSLGTVSYTWSNLPQGTLMTLSVACIYDNPYELYANGFTVRTAGSPAPPPGPGGHTIDDLYNLAKAVNAGTLGRMEGEIMDIRKFLDAINQTTLGRIEAEVMDIREFLDAINQTTLGRMDGEIQAVEAKL